MCVLKKHVLVKYYSKIPHSRFGGGGNAIHIKYLVRCCVSEFFPRFILAESFLIYAKAKYDSLVSQWCDPCSSYLKKESKLPDI